MNKFPYRQGVYALILNKENKLLLVFKRGSKIWGFPGGGVDEGETKEEAIRRELLEELSVKEIDILLEAGLTYRYDWPETEIERHYKKTGLKRRGQEQIHYIMRFNGSDEDISLQKEELSDFKWVSGTELKDYLNYQDQIEYVAKVFQAFNNPNIFEDAE